jgi:hypothetical protein
MDLSTIIIFVVAAVIVVGVFTVLISLRIRVAKAAKRSRAERKAEHQEHPSEIRYAAPVDSSVVWASAEVMDSRPDPADFGANQVRTALTINVTPPDSAACQVSVVWLVNTDALHLVTPGSHITVSLSGYDEKSICPAVPWASVAKWYQK